MNPAKLLLACRQSYAIAPEGTVGDCQGAASIGWLKQPLAVVAGCNAALIGNTAEGTVLAIRGTLPPSDPAGIADWSEDLDANPVVDPAYQGTVHAGFRDGFAELWPGITAAFVGTDGPDFITGHSLGGALAHFAAYSFKPYKPQTVTFAAPRVGNDVFVAALNALTPLTRYENGGDIVPTVPPLLYKSAGVPRLIWQGQVLTAYPNGWSAAVIRTVLNGTIIEAHSIGPGAAYPTALGLQET